MTILIGWLGVDSRGPCSAYLLSDSRYSLESGNSSAIYDYGRKLYALKNYPDIFGYCGDVTFAQTTLSQITELADSNLLFSKSDSADNKKEKVLSQLKMQFENYKLYANQPVAIYHLSRDLDFQFRAYKYGLDSSCIWYVNELKYNERHSNLIFADGSGKNDFERRYYATYQQGDLKDTSRNIYQCFCDMLCHNSLQSCGGSPQLVSCVN